VTTTIKLDLLLSLPLITRQSHTTSLSQLRSPPRVREWTEFDLDSEVVPTKCAYSRNKRYTTVLPVTTTIKLDLLLSLPLITRRAHTTSLSQLRSPPRVREWTGFDLDSEVVPTKCAYSRNKRYTTVLPVVLCRSMCGAHNARKSLTDWLACLMGEGDFCKIQNRCFGTKMKCFLKFNL
jgi:hypothetical protein